MDDENTKSPWQQERDKFLLQEAEKKRAQEKAERAKFLRGLKISHKSEKNLHSLVKKQEDDADESDEAEAKETKVKIKKEPSKRVLLFRRFWPLILVFILAFLGAFYMISPASKLDSFKVTGNIFVSSSEIATASGLHVNASVPQILLDKSKIEAKVVASSSRIKEAKLELSLPNKFTIHITEFQSIGYVVQRGRYYNLLSNGLVIHDTAISKEKLKENTFILDNFTNDQAKKFADAYETLKPSLQSLIRTVTLTPTQSTKDFISLSMSDGNTVKVPLSQMQEKLPYYPSVAKEVKSPTTIDMEIGIFAVNSTTYSSEFADDTPNAKTSSSSSTASSSSSAAGTSASSSASTTTSSSQ